jgi:hypothetical protein
LRNYSNDKSYEKKSDRTSDNILSIFPDPHTGKKVYADDHIIKVGDKSPDFMINEAGGKSYKLSDLKGKVVMFQFDAMKRVIFAELSKK